MVRFHYNMLGAGQLKLYNVIGHLLPAAIGLLLLSTLVSVWTGIDKTLLTALLTYPVLLGGLVVVSSTNIPKIQGWFWVLGFLGWYLLVWVGWDGFNMRAITRVTSVVAQVILFTAALVTFSRNAILWKRFWAGCSMSSISFIVISNLINPQLGYSIHYIVFERYDGIVGPNAHGLASAIAVISLISYRDSVNHRRGQWIIAAALVLALLNLWATGSRLSLLTLGTFLLLRLRWRHARYILLLLGLSALLLIEIALINWDTLRPLLRLDDYSLFGRINPLFWAWQTTVQNRFAPFGFVLLLDEIQQHRLDSAFFVLLLEAGWPSILLIAGLVIHTLSTCNALHRRSGNTNTRRIAQNARAVLSALCIHGFGENALFTGSNIATWLFWIVIGAVHGVFWHERRQNTHSLPHQ